MSKRSLQDIEADLLRRVAGIARARTPLNPGMEIYHDLGITGDDAAELLDAIQKHYGTDFMTLRFDDYFPNETDAFLLHIASRLGFRDRTRKSLTIAHLATAVMHGAWFQPSFGTPRA